MSFYSRWILQRASLYHYCIIFNMLSIKKSSRIMKLVYAPTGDILSTVVPIGAYLLPFHTIFLDLDDVTSSIV